jgi:hypothetical protein
MKKTQLKKQRARWEMPNETLSPSTMINPKNALYKKK